MTPADIAALLAPQIHGDYHGNSCHIAARSDGDVVALDVTPYTGDGPLPMQRYRALFVEDPAYPVAAAPVELPAELARELVAADIGKTIDGWTVADDVELGHGRWIEHRQLVIRSQNGEHFSAFYEEGLTEEQDITPWEDVTTVQFIPVRPRYRVEQDWVPATGGEQGAGR